MQTEGPVDLLARYSVGDTMPPAETYGSLRSLVFLEKHLDKIRLIPLEWRTKICDANKCAIFYPRIMCWGNIFYSNSTQFLLMAVYIIFFESIDVNCQYEEKASIIIFYYVSRYFIFS